jgi:hypothetical protein
METSGRAAARAGSRFQAIAQDRSTLRRVPRDRDRQERSRLQIDVELPSKWFPRDEADRGLGPPTVESSCEEIVRVPALGDHNLRFNAYSRAPREAKPGAPRFGVAVG